MRNSLIRLCAAGALAAAAPAAAQQVEAHELILDNGMKFLLVPRQSQPNSIAAGWLAKVGSANERPGITGIAHFFEHMMFKGTTTIGTRDPQADRGVMDELQEVRERLYELQVGQQYERARRGEIDDPWDAADDTPEMAELRAKMRELMEKQREIIVKDEFDQVYTAQGGSSMNAFTSHDVTFYFINVPSNKFELWAWMESDRLRDSVFREFYAERDVVHEERRLRLESTPTGKFQEQFDSMFWMSSPYNWPIIGWSSDLNSYTRQQAEDFYDTYYRPNNLVGVIVGDFEVSEVAGVIERYFSSLERGAEAPPVVTRTIPQQAEMRMYAQGDLQPQIEVRYHAVPFGHEDMYPLQILSQILNGRTGRLYRAMVEGAEIASSAGAFVDARKHAGAFSFRAETKGDATPQQLEEAWYAALDDLRKNPVTERELQKVKNGVAADAHRRLQSNFFLMIQLGMLENYVGWREINEGPQRLMDVTAEDLRRAADTYFDPTNRSVAIYTRSSSAPAEDPELLALDPQVRQMVKTQLAQLMQVEDPAMLRQVLERIGQQSAQAPPQFRPAMELIQKRVEARIAELESR